MICPWPPTPIFRFAFSGGPAAAPAGAAADVGAGALDVEPEQPASRRAPNRSKNSLRMLLTIDLNALCENLPRRGGLPADEALLELGDENLDDHDHDAQHQHSSPDTSRVQ